MKPATKRFTRSNPCTKLDIWNCFRAKPGMFVPVQYTLAQSMIGLNVPRVMERNGYLRLDHGPKALCYVLTEEGEAWLEKGIRSFLRNHPTRAGEAKYLPAEKKRRTRRVR